MRLCLAILVALTLAPRPGAAAPSEGRRLYEQKCLYCHSGAAADRQRLEPSQWRRLIETMRARAPLLISKREAETIYHYFVNERRQLRAVSPRPRPATVAVSVAPTTPAPSTLLSSNERLCATVRACGQAEPELEAEPEPEDTEAEERGPQLFADRCSKCHTLRRAYLRVDSVEHGRSLIERMRRKMGSGITTDDVALLERFLRSRIARTGQSPQ